MQNTYMLKPAEVTRAWHVVDAADAILGKVAAEVAAKLIGKHKKEFTPHVDAGDFVIVLNATKVVVTGDKANDKLYYSYSGFPGGIRSKSLGRLTQQNPEKVIEKAVYNMLPKNKLRSARMNRLKVFVGAEHPHQSQVAAQNQAKA